MRQLATIRRIDDIQPIDGADRIEVLIIGGWSCVVQKGIHQKGNLVVYFEIDSFLDGSDSRFESFRERFTKFNGKQGLRVKTIKLRRQISQGVVMPLSVFPEIKSPKEGDDVTEVLKIVKWEREDEAVENLGGRKLGQSRPCSKFPRFIKQTDQPRIQNMRLQHHEASKFEISVKLDGSSMTVAKITPTSPFYAEAIDIRCGMEQIERPSLVGRLKHWFNKKFNRYNEPVYLVCSRNVNLNWNDGSLFTSVAKSQVLPTLVEYQGPSIALQGELIAPSIQANWEGVDKPSFNVFDVWDIDEQKYLKPDDRQDLVAELGVPHVPIIGNKVRLDELLIPGSSINDSILSFASGPGAYGGKHREGVVFKIENGTGVSFKAISNEYLLAKS